MNRVWVRIAADIDMHRREDARKQQDYLLLLAVLYAERGFTPKTEKKMNMLRCMTVVIY